MEMERVSTPKRTVRKVVKSPVSSQRDGEQEERRGSEWKVRIAYYRGGDIRLRLSLAETSGQYLLVLTTSPTGPQVHNMPPG